MPLEYIKDVRWRFKISHINEHKLWISKRIKLIVKIKTKQSVVSCGHDKEVVLRGA